MINIVKKTRRNDLDAYFPLIEEYYLKTVEVLDIPDQYDLSVILCGPVTIHRINREYRNIDAVTDVISFAMLDEADDYDLEEDNIILGDIFINLNRVLSQAEEYGHSTKREFVFLFVHGLLHLFGYDHMDKKDEEKMFSLQKKILGDLN